MTYRIPPSLNWLIKKRGSLAGDIIRTKRSLKKVQHLVTKLNKLEEELKTIDSTLKLHEIQINVENIKPIRPKTNSLGFPHGYINQYVLKYLIDNYSSQPINKTEIVNFLISKNQEHQKTPATYDQITHAVKNSLFRHLMKGHVIRHHPLITSQEGLWQLSPKYVKIHLPHKFHNESNDVFKA